MEDRGKGREGVCTGDRDLTHDIDRDGACLTNRHLDARTAIALAQLILDLLVGLRDRETGNMDGTKIVDDNRAIGRNLELVGLLRGAIDIDEHLVARANDITRRRGNVHGWLKG